MNTLESIKKECSEPGWDGYTAEPIKDIVLENAKLVQPFIPDDFELFPCGDGSVQWENTESKEDDIFEVVEIYEDEFYLQSIKPFEINDNDTVIKESNDINEFVKYLKQRFVENKIKEIEKDFKNC